MKVLNEAAEAIREREEQVAELEAARLESNRLREGLSSAARMLRAEDAGWASPLEGMEPGLSLGDLKKWSKEIRTSLTGTRDRPPNPHMRNGFMLRQSYIWSEGIRYNDVPKSSQGKRGAQADIDDAENQRRFFDASSRRRREMALFADGLYLAVGDDSTRKLRTVPIAEITDTHRDEVFVNDILAYRWTREELKDAEKPEQGREKKSYWVFTDATPKKARPSTILYNGKSEEVLNMTAFDLIPNRPDGYAFGSPDAIAAVVWARVIRDLLMNGVKMQEALAMFAFKVASDNSTAAQGAAAMIANGAAAGSTAAMGSNTSLVPMSSAGRGYDFDSIRLVVSTMAASLHVSGIALAADTAFAGSSYGAAQTLDMPTRLAMESRRQEHVEFDKRVLHWLGAGEARVWFEPFNDAVAMMREVQAAMLGWSTGTVSPQEFRDLLERIFGEPLSGSMPRGVLVPNTKATWTFQNPAAEPSPAPAGGGDDGDGVPKQAGGGGQGQSTGAGSTGNDDEM